MTTIDYKALASAFVDELVQRLNGHTATEDKPTSTAKAGSKAAAKEEAQPEAKGDIYDSMSLKELRDELVERGYGRNDVKTADRPTLLETLREDDESNGSDEEASADEPEDEDVETDEADEAEDEEADEEDDSEEGDTYSRDELEEMSLAEIKKVAREAGFTTADLKGLDQDSIIDALLGEAEEESEEEDEDSDEEVELDEDSLMEMSRAEVLAIAKEYGVGVKRGAKQEDIVAAILEAAEEE